MLLTAQFLISIFWALIGGERAWSSRQRLNANGLWLQNPTKKLAHVRVLLGHLLSQNHIPKVYDLGPLLYIRVDRYDVSV